MTASRHEHSVGGTRAASLMLGALVAVLLTVTGAALAQETAPTGNVQPSAPQQQNLTSPQATAPATPVEAAPAAQPGTTTNVEAGAGSAAAARIPHDLSPWGMFMAADIIVKAVMSGLAFASLVTWTVWLAKGLELLGAKRRARKAVEMLGKASGLTQATEQVSAGAIKQGPAAALIETAYREAKQSDNLPPEGIKERVAISLSRIEARAGRQMTRGTGVLATIGSTAPFVGLFGTVWGIMNSFIGISQAQTTNLAVVAPGIAEALLATAIGLVAAIPAVVVYNVFARSIAGYRALLADASAEVMRHLSRDLDRRMVSVSAPASLQSMAAVRARMAE